jgi:hypothetical protein
MGFLAAIDYAMKLPYDIIAFIISAAHINQDFVQHNTRPP